MGIRTWFREFKEWLHDTFMYFLIGEQRREGARGWRAWQRKVGRNCSPV